MLGINKSGKMLIPDFSKQIAYVAQLYAEWTATEDCYVITISETANSEYDSPNLTITPKNGSAVSLVTRGDIGVASFYCKAGDKISGSNNKIQAFALKEM